MPFTFSHPAIVLPLTFLPKKWFSLTGLVVGSLTPDFEYFIRMKVESNYSHTLSGLFWFDIPLGLLLAFIYHNYVRHSLLDNLPTLLKSKLVKFDNFEWNRYFKTNWFVIIISVFIGAVSHLFWDSFTHDTGYFVQTIPYLTTKIEILNKQIPLFKILQHSSTLIGGLIICLSLSRLPKENIKTREIDLKYWSILTVLTLTIISIRLFSGLEFIQFGSLIVTVISATLISLILTPGILKTAVDLQSKR
jgi:hypothetical protein